jgi:hypothetical protein
MHLYCNVRVPLHVAATGMARRSARFEEAIAGMTVTEIIRAGRRARKGSILYAAACTAIRISPAARQKIDRARQGSVNFSLSALVTTILEYATMSRPKAAETKDQMVATTRLPSRLQAYMKSLANLQYGTLSAMHTAMLDEFLLRKPWQHGLEWRETKALSERDQADHLGGRFTGWMQVNFRLSDEMVEKIKQLARENGVTPSSVLYTCCYWWCWYKFPPQQEAAQREKQGLPVDIDALAG